MTDLKLSLADESDLETIRNLAHEIWWEHYPPIIGENQVKYMLNLMYSESVLTELIKNNRQHFYLIQNGEFTSGFLAVEKKGNNELFLQKFYVLLNHQNRGLGEASFNLLLEQYPKVEVIRLQVNRMNFRPINFYFKLGFKIELVKDFDIGDGYFMEDFVMIKKLNNG